MQGITDRARAGGATRRRAVRTGGVAVLASLVASGCWATYTRQDVVVAPAALVRGGFVMVATPADGEYGKHHYEGSGQATAWAVRSALLSYVNRLLIDEHCATLECMKQTQDAAVTYDVVPQVLHWEDRNTGWSMRPDRISIRVSVYDASTSALLASAVIHGASTRMDETPNPSDLLDEPVRKYFESLFAPTAR